MNRLPTLSRPFNHWKIEDVGRNLFFHSSIFDGVEDFFKDVSFPKYNVLKDGDNLVIEIALAGYKKEDLTVEITPENALVVKSEDVSQDNTNDNPLNNGYVHRGIASRKFRVAWNLGTALSVGEITFENGLLTIPLKSKSPPKPKTKLLEIN
jgi:molecular chaperone IbpA